MLWALLQLEHPVYAPLGSLIIGSQLSGAASEGTCRIAFYAKVIESITDKEVLKVYKPKERIAVVNRVVSEYEVIGNELLEKGGNIQPVCVVFLVLVCSS